VRRLAALEHRHELRQPVRAHRRVRCRRHPVDHGVAVDLGERREGRAGGGRGGERGQQVLGLGGGRLARVGAIPATVGLRALDLADPRRPHPPLGRERRDQADVALRPQRRPPPGGEPAAEHALVDARGLPVDPPAAQCLVERLRVGEGGRIRRALLREHQPHAVGRLLVPVEPGAPRGAVGDGEEVVHGGGHGSDATDGRRPR
jgi:hypothetical protein